MSVVVPSIALARMNELADYNHSARIGPMDLPSDSAIRWLVRRYAGLLTRDELRSAKRRLVLPTAEFFPDAFDGDQGSFNLLFWRLQEHASLTDLDVELRLVDDREETSSSCKCGSGGCKDGGCGDGGCGSGGCGSGGCGCGHGKHGETTLTNVEKLRDGGWRVDVRVSDTRNATALTAAMARSLAHVLLLNTGGFGDWPDGEQTATCEVAATILGFGVLVSNASYMYAKACKGVSIDHATALDVSSATLALALSVGLNNHPHAQVVAHLDPTQRDAYGEARMWVESNARLLKRIHRDPKIVAADESISVEQSRPWLARVLGLGAKKRNNQVDLEDEKALAAIAASMAEKRKQTQRRDDDPRTLEIRALVEESLGEFQTKTDDSMHK